MHAQNENTTPSMTNRRQRHQNAMDVLAHLAGAITAGRLVCYWNLPLFSYSSIDPQLSDKTVYNTLIRMMSPFNHMATCLGKLFQHYRVSSTVA